MRRRHRRHRSALRFIVLTAGLGALAAATASQRAPAPPRPSAAATHHRRGVGLHEQRRLEEASRAYARALELDPPRAPSTIERDIVRRFTPRLYTTPTEPFGLKDVAGVLHPTDRLVAYHLFWDDDIDFPDDNDPCDHEVVWVGFAADGRAIESVWTYFHGRILAGGETALQDARAHGMRPRVNVQWGKHGSLPAGWEALPIQAEAGDVERRYLPAGPLALAEYQRATWRKLHDEGRRLLDHPLARRLRWPDRFDGSLDDFVDFSQPLDPLPLLDRDELLAVSRWNSAVINQRFLAYNFRPKTEWPRVGVIVLGAATPFPPER